MEREKICYQMALEERAVNRGEEREKMESDRETKNEFQKFTLDRIIT